MVEHVTAAFVEKKEKLKTKYKSKKKYEISLLLLIQKSNDNRAVKMAAFVLCLCIFAGSEMSADW